MSFAVCPFQGIRLTEIRQKKTNIMRFHLYVKSKTRTTKQDRNRLTDTENKRVVTRRVGWGLGEIFEVD